MQFQEDIIEVPVIRPVVNETTALGAAYAAGLAASGKTKTTSTATGRRTSGGTRP
jgi:glycerol kinase